jgi:hypothetical protein
VFCKYILFLFYFSIVAHIKIALFKSPFCLLAKLICQHTLVPSIATATNCYCYTDRELSLFCVSWCTTGESDIFLFWHFCDSGWDWCFRNSPFMWTVCANVTRHTLFTTLCYTYWTTWIQNWHLKQIWRWNRKWITCSLSAVLLHGRWDMNLFICANMGFYSTLLYVQLQHSSHCKCSFLVLLLVLFWLLLQVTLL